MSYANLGSEKVMIIGYGFVSAWGITPQDVSPTHFSIFGLNILLYKFNKVFRTKKIAF